MELKSNLVIPSNFSPSQWISYFHTNSNVFSETTSFMPKYNDNLFTNTSTIGKLNFEDATHCGIYLIQVKKPLTDRTARKKQFDKAIEILKNEYLQAGLFVFYDANNSFRFSLIYPIYKGTKRSYSNYRRHSFYVSENLPNKTYQLQLSKYKMDSLAELKEMFSVERVSDLFYQEFKNEYDELKKGIKHLYNQEVSEQQSGDFGLLFIIRIIFLGFVQKKGWLGNNNFIQDYLKSYNPDIHKNGIYQDLLCPLFFQALNLAPSKKNKFSFPHISEPYKTYLVNMPYLNGGLFRKHQDYDFDALYITNEAIIKFIEFLFSYNFTLEENTLYDEELELNPEFLGIIFEKLINKEYGAIYTPRLEVDFMCRISLVKYLQKNCLPSLKLDNLYKLFFPEYDDEGDQTPGEFTPEEAKDILDKLEQITICDPAIGSGAFAVGMLNILDEIECLLYDKFLHQETPNTPFERKKRIIFQSLYGVEVKQWAVWITQLRLWITLLIEAEDDLKNSEEPLLPSFDFKIRQGDSLIQMLGNYLFPVSGEGLIAPEIQKNISALIKLKTDYYYNKSLNKLQEIEYKQRELYIQILEKKIRELQSSLNRLKGESIKEVQSNIFNSDYKAELDLITRKQKHEEEKLKYQIDTLNYEINQIKNNNLPFVWKIDFPEIFIGKGGFDIIIGNPPYVPQEEIEDPLGKIDRNKYKALKTMAAQDFPQDLNELSINGKSDLYTFFYIRGLRLLNPNGILTYISSNSWLDVEFGAWLQKFLLENCPVYFIIDNLSKRVFRSAGINTIIAVIGAKQKMVASDDLIRFAAFKLPFESSLYTENFLTIEETQNRIDYDYLRVNPVPRIKLLEEGLNNSTENKYQGSKWGSIYIKAPDIYFTIMEKAKDKLIKLGNVATITRGYTTGADEFFYIPKSNPYNIEKEFLKPVIKSPRECQSILINPDELKYWLFMCPYEKKEIKGTNALKYIEMGETVKKYIKQGKDKGKYIIGINNVSTVKGRKNWFDLGVRELPELITPSSFNDTFKVYLNNGVLANKRLYEIHYQGLVDIIALILNSTLFFFYLELISSSSLGEGLLDITVFEFESTYIINPQLLLSQTNLFEQLNCIKNRKILSIFEELQVDYLKCNFKDANPLPDRKALDDVIFSILGLSDSEIKAVYSGLLELTSNRLKKANSLKT
jgi:methylase of polypeptide subunit release factors